MIFLLCTIIGVLFVNGIFLDVYIEKVESAINKSNRILENIEDDLRELKDDLSHEPE